jgi:hypothetical protein
VRSLFTRTHCWIPQFNIKTSKDQQIRHAMPTDLDPSHPTPPRDREDSPARSEHSVSDSGSENEEVPQWVQQTLAKSQNDGRVQPWKKIFKSDRVLEHIENTLEDDKDLVVVPAPKMPSAGEATIFEQQSLAG